MRLNGDADVPKCGGEAEANRCMEQAQELWQAKICREIRGVTPSKLCPIYRVVDNQRACRREMAAAARSKW